MKDPIEHLPQHRSPSICLSISFLTRGLALPLLIGLVACGGGHAGADGPQTPSTPPAASGSSPAAAASEAPSGGAAGPATTTTQGLADAGGTPGAKLPDAPSASSASASGDAKTRGPHDHDPGRGVNDIKAIVTAHREEARACYDKALADHPGIEGDLYISWTIDPKGNVTKTAPDLSRSQITEPAVIACVSEVIRHIQFAPSPGGFESKAGYPFNFHPHHAKAAQ